MKIKKHIVIQAIISVSICCTQFANANGFADDIREWNVLRLEQEKAANVAEKIFNSSSPAHGAYEENVDKNEDEFFVYLYDQDTDDIGAQATQVVLLASSLIRLGKHKSPIAKLAADDLRIETIFTKNISKILSILHDPANIENLRFFSSTYANISNKFKSLFSSLPKRPSAEIVGQYIEHIHEMIRKISMLELQELNRSRKIIAEEVANVSKAANEAMFESIKKNHELYRSEQNTMLHDLIDELYGPEAETEKRLGLEGKEESLRRNQSLEEYQEFQENARKAKRTKLDQGVKRIIRELDKKYPPFVAEFSNGEAIKVSYSENEKILQFYKYTRPKIETVIVKQFTNLPESHKAEKIIRELRLVTRNLERYQDWSSRYGGKSFVKYKKILPIIGSALGFVVFTELMFTNEIEASEMLNPVLVKLEKQTIVRNEQLKSLFWNAYFENNAQAMSIIFSVLTNPNYFKNILDPSELKATEKSLDFKEAMCPTPDKRLEQIYRHPQVALIIDRIIAQNKALFESAGSKLTRYYQSYSSSLQRRQVGEPATLQLR